MERITISNGFVRDFSGIWHNLSKVDKFFTNDDSVYIEIDHEIIQIECFEDNEKSQRALDNGFHYYLGYNRNFIEVCEENDLSPSVRLESTLRQNRVLSVRQAYEQYEKSGKVPGMGLKTWREFGDCISCLRRVLP